MIPYSKHPVKKKKKIKVVTFNRSGRDKYIKSLNNISNNLITSIIYVPDTALTFHKHYLKSHEHYVE